MMRCHILAAISLAALAAGAGTTVPLASPLEIETAAEQETGSLHWHETDDGRAILSVGTLGHGRRAISDPYALHRVRLGVVEQPAYDIALGEGVAVSNGWFVLFDHRQQTHETVTRSVTLTPADGVSLGRAEITNGRRDAAGVEADNGRIVISMTSRQPPPGDAQYDDCAFSLDAVYALATRGEPERDDLTGGDYYFTDTVGECSLGTIREWCNGQHRGRLADSWSRYRATEPVRISGQPVTLDVLGQYRIETEAGTNSVSSARLMMGATEAVTFEAEVSTNSTALRVMRFEFDPGSREARMWCSDFGHGHVIEASTDALGPDMAWEELETDTHYGERAMIDGVTCVYMTAQVPEGEEWDMAFFRAGADLGETRAASVTFRVPMVARKGVVLEAPDGTLWRLRVANDGTLSTEAY